MKVKKITVKNLKSVSEMTADFNGCTAIITGGNNKWKSTFLKSFVDRIQWSKLNNIVKKWEIKGSCEYELTDWNKFIWEIKWETEKLSYITKEWLKIDRWVIKELWERFFWNWFDIDEFLQSTPKKQKEQLQKVLWIDLSKIEEEYKIAYDNRTNKNAIMKNEQARNNDTININYWYDLINVFDKEQIISKALESNNNIEYVEKWLKEKELLFKDIEGEITRLQEKKDTIYNDIIKWKEYLLNNKPIDINKQKKELQEIKNINQIIRKNIEIKKQNDITKQAEVDWASANDKVKEIDNVKFKILKDAKIPEWFEFTDDWLLYNWFELDKKQLSSSSIYIASLKLASMGLWEVRTLCFDASYLDKNSLQDIEKRAEKEWLQLLIERPDFDWWELKYEILS